MGSRVLRGVVLSGVVLAGSLACSPCQSSVEEPQEVCLPADGGGPQPGAAFVLTARSYYGGYAELSGCTVGVDAGVISITVTDSACGGGGSPNNPVIKAASTFCEIPALPAGSYAVGGGTPWTLTIPSRADDQSHSCAD
jgi:hypothetical protein